MSRLAIERVYNCMESSLNRFAVSIVWIAFLALGAAPGQSQRPLLTGYFPQWGLYQDPQYLVKNLRGNARLLDQINYSQGFVKGGRCSVADPNADTNVAFTAAQSVDGVADTPAQPLKGNFNQLIKLKRLYPHLKLVLSLEGNASDFAADSQPEARAAFVKSCVDLWIKGDVAPGVALGTLFDGIDIDWEYPHEADSANYIELLKEFRRQMDAARPHTLLNVAVGPNPRMMGGANMATVSNLVNEVGLMSYDFNGPWGGRTGFAAALSGDVGSGTMSKAVDAYLAAGVPPEKLLAGVPFYGYGWRLVPEDNNGLYQEGQAIRGDRSYREIESKIAKSTVYRDQSSQSPWLFDGDEFWTYDDPISVTTKANYVLDQGLGGVMIWELGEDNDNATLLNAIYDGMRTNQPLRSPEETR